MNLILLFDEDFTANTRVSLKGRRYEHVTTVLKVKTGARLTVGQCNGKIGFGIVVNLNDALEMEVSFDQDPPKPLPLKLVLALPRPHLLKRSLFFAAMLGIKEIHLLNFNRVEKSLWNSSALKPQSIQEHLTLGLEQAKDTHMPSVVLHTSFKPFVEDTLPSLIKGTIALVAHPGGEEMLARTVTPTTLVIGPEGGIVPYELEMLKSTGFAQVGFGERILRVDAALVYVVSKLF